MRLFASGHRPVRQITFHRRPLPAFWLSLCALLAVPGAEAATSPVASAAPGIATTAEAAPAALTGDAAPVPEAASASEEFEEVMEQLANSPLRPVPDYSTASDHELTRLGANWDMLNKDEKAALLREVKLRMAQRKDRSGVLMIRTQRRYGRVYGGGQYLKIETQVVRISPQAAAELSGHGFGVGFEQRNAEVSVVAEPAEPSGHSTVPPVDSDGTAAPPVVRVTEVSQ